MKLLSTIIGCLLLFSLLEGCKKQYTPSAQFSQAYTRFVFVDAPGQGNVQFYLDGLVNANGDSSINNPDGSVYQPDNSIPTTTLVNYPSGGWTDNSPPTSSGTYGYNYTSAASYTYFPNPTDRIGLAPIINNINYFQWAALPATQHELTLYSVIPASLYGNTIYVKGSQFLDQEITTEGGAVQTFFVVNEAPCKFYEPAGINASAGLPIYSVKESLNFFSDQFGIVSMKDHPNKLPAFKDSSAYIRFMNVTPYFSDQTMNQNTDSIDVYIAPMFGTNPDVQSGLGLFSTSIDSIGAEIPVALNLGRFQSTIDAPFYELNLSANMLNNNAGPDDSAHLPGVPRVARYYRVLVYRSGHSSATGDLPLAQGDWLAVYSEFAAYDHGEFATDTDPLGIELDTWLLRWDGANYHPAVCTIPIAVTNDPNPGAATANVNYLSFRSCINYIKAGINNVYFGD